MKKINNNKVKKIRRFSSYNYTQLSFAENEWNFKGQGVRYIPIYRNRRRFESVGSILKDYMTSDNSYGPLAKYHPGDTVWFVNDSLKIVSDVIDSVDYYGSYGSLIAYTLSNHSCGSSGNCEHGDLFPTRKMTEFHYPYIRIEAIKNREEDRQY